MTSISNKHQVKNKWGEFLIEWTKTFYLKLSSEFLEYSMFFYHNKPNWTCFTKRIVIYLICWVKKFIHKNPCSQMPKKKPKNHSHVKTKLMCTKYVTDNSHKWDKRCRVRKNCQNPFFGWWKIKITQRVNKSPFCGMTEPQISWELSNFLLLFR